MLLGVSSEFPELSASLCELPATAPAPSLPACCLPSSRPPVLSFWNCKFQIIPSFYRSCFGVVFYCSNRKVTKT